jgi:hypothetical protein
VDVRLNVRDAALRTSGLSARDGRQQRRHAQQRNDRNCRDNLAVFHKASVLIVGSVRGERIGNLGRKESTAPIPEMEEAN